MQVERSPSGESGGRVSNTYGTYPVVGDSRGKPRVSPHAAGPIGGVGEMLFLREGQPPEGRAAD